MSVNKERLLLKFGTQLTDILKLFAKMDQVDRINMASAIITSTILEIPDEKGRMKVLDSIYDMIRKSFSFKLTKTTCVLCGNDMPVIEGSEDEITICAECLTGGKHKCH